MQQQALNYLNAPPDILAKASRIRLLLLDVDGVLSDGRIFFDSQGIESKAFNTKDGHGLKSLKQSGVEVGIITGRKSPLTERRATELGIHLLIQGREDKAVALNELLEQFPCALEDIAFMGDDYPDLTVMTKVGLALSVADGHFAVKALSHWISPRKGGEGAVRDACDLIMTAQGTFDDALAQYTANNPPHN